MAIAENTVISIIEITAVYKKKLTWSCSRKHIQRPFLDLAERVKVISFEKLGNN